MGFCRVGGSLVMPALVAEECSGEEPTAQQDREKDAKAGGYHQVGRKLAGRSDRTIHFMIRRNSATACCRSVVMRLR